MKRSIHAVFLASHSRSRETVHVQPTPYILDTTKLKDDVCSARLARSFAVRWVVPLFLLERVTLSLCILYGTGLQTHEHKKVLSSLCQSYYGNTLIAKISPCQNVFKLILGFPRDFSCKSSEIKCWMFWYHFDILLPRQ